MDITPNDYIFKQVEELKKGDKYILNDKIYTVIDIRYLRCRGNVHHKLRHIISTIITEELNEMARIPTMLIIGDATKLEHAKRLYDDETFWVRKMIDAVEAAGETGISRMGYEIEGGEYIDGLTDIADKSQLLVNPKIKDLINIGLFAESGSIIPKKVKSTEVGQRGRKVGNKTLVAKEVNSKLEADNEYQANEAELEILRRPGIKPRPSLPLDPDAPRPPPLDPTAWMTEFLYDDGTAKYVQSHLIINEGLNNFKGMKCFLGFESINIDANGDIYSSWCGAKHFGNISNLDSWELPSLETECPFDFCNNISDIAITKIA